MATASQNAMIEYPDSDGQPLAENTLQYQWIVMIQGNLDLLFRHQPDVFVAGDNLIYPVEGHPEIRMAPDIYVAFGRPKGHRGSYRVWEEAGIFPQVVFEILSPGNRAREMQLKLEFYERHGAEEYYVYDPDHNRLVGYRRVGDRLVVIPDMVNFVSPRLGIRFEYAPEELVITTPAGERFLTFMELGEQAEEARKRVEDERARANRERTRANQEARRVEQEAHRATLAEEKAARLAARLRELGLDPEQDL